MTADIHHIASEKFHIKNNIFVFHSLSPDLTQTMEVSGRNKNDISCVYFKRGKIHLSHPHSFLDINNFHSILPVQENRGEIIGDGAEIYIVGKHEFRMFFCFVISDAAFGRRFCLFLHNDRIVSYVGEIVQAFFAGEWYNIFNR